MFIAVHGLLFGTAPEPASRSARAATAPATPPAATAPGASEPQEGRELAKTVGGKLEVGRANPGGSDSALQPKRLLGCLVGCAEGALPGLMGPSPEPQAGVTTECGLFLRVAQGLQRCQARSEAAPTFPTKAAQVGSWDTRCNGRS